MTAPAPTTALLDHAVQVRREWLAVGLATKPSDRIVAEEAIGRIYRRHQRLRPRFVWVCSPQNALPFLGGMPDHDELTRWIAARTPIGRPPLLSDIAAGLSRLRSALDAAADDPRLGSRSRFGKDKQPSLREVLHQSVREPLRRSLAHHLPVRAALGILPSAWYGQQEAHWIAFYDLLRRAGLARYAAADEEQFDDWADLARSTGWWWPGESVCVAVERPSTIDTELVRSSPHEEVRVRSVAWH